MRAPFSADWPLELLNTWTFTEQAGKTTITMRAVPTHATEAERKTFEGAFASLEQGSKGTFDQLAEYLAKAELLRTYLLTRYSHPIGVEMMGEQCPFRTNKVTLCRP